MNKKIGKAELVWAYELRSKGCSDKRIATGLGIGVEYLRALIRRAERDGLESFK